MFDAIILGIIQGITEFLPVSSSAHLLIFERVLGFEGDDHSFTVAIHLATTIAVILYFWKDIFEISKGFIAPKQKEERSNAINIIVASVPVLIIGYIIKDTAWFGAITSNLYVIGSSLILFSVLLYLADKRSLNQPEKYKKTRITLFDSLVIGLSQIIAAVFPGASRSGITLTTGLSRNITREKLARFVFLISIPVSGLASAYEIFFGGSLTLNHNFMVAFISAFISGLGAIHFLLEIIKKYSLKWFCLYRIFFGLLILTFAVI